MTGRPAVVLSTTAGLQPYTLIYHDILLYTCIRHFNYNIWYTQS